MAATGKTCPKTCRLTQRDTGTCIQWRDAGVIEQLMTVLHERVREQVKKRQMDNVDHYRLTSGTEYLQCECGVEGVLLLQRDQWERVLGQILCPKISHHQTSSGSRYVGVSLLYALHESKRFR